MEYYLDEKWQEIIKFIVAPLILFGEGNYALTDVKEIDVTEEYLGLDENIKHCQNRETFQQCQAREYIRNGLEKCKCTKWGIIPK